MQVVVPLEDFKLQLYGLLVQRLPVLEAMTSGLVNQIEHARIEHDLENEPLIMDFSKCTPGTAT